MGWNTKHIVKLACWTTAVVLPLACGVEKGGKVSNVGETTAVENTPAPGGENTVTTLSGLVAGKEFTAGKAWVPIGTSIIHFTSGATNGCSDDSIVADFTIAGIPSTVGDISTEEVAALTIDATDVDTDVTNFTGTLSLTRVTQTDIEGVMDITAPDQADAYQLKGSFSAVKCEIVSSDDGGDDGTTDGSTGSNDGIYKNWVTACDSDTSSRYWLTITDDQKFTMRTYLFDDTACETIGVRLTRKGTIGLNTETSATEVGEPIDFNYDTADINMYTSAAIQKANAHTYTDATQSANGLCGIQFWNANDTFDVAGKKECFPYDETLAHSTRRDKMVYEVTDDELKLGVVDDLIYETESRDAVSERATAYTHTFTPGTISE